ncbi:hypothetical protein ACFV8Z_45200 [Streptomyces sp. NPDC059837]|uniref:hypothetical protein n=1 Tax=Streptomyces sp. NPDC059837 TaxID=3346968 RepID=UPI003667F159
MPQPCVLCGRPARHEAAGYPQHLDPAECTPATTTATAVPAQAATRPPAPAQHTPRPAPDTSGSRSTPLVPLGRRAQSASQIPDLIGDA